MLAVSCEASWYFCSRNNPNLPSPPVVDAPCPPVYKKHVDNALNNMPYLLDSPEVGRQLDLIFAGPFQVNCSVQFHSLCSPTWICEDTNKDKANKASYKTNWGSDHPEESFYQLSFNLTHDFIHNNYL